MTKHYWTDVYIRITVLCNYRYSVDQKTHELTYESPELQSKK